MLIGVNHLHCFTVKFPGPCVLVKLHINLGTCCDNLCLVHIELELVSLAIVTDNLESTLEAAGRVGENICVISNTYCSNAVGS